MPFRIILTVLFLFSPAGLDVGQASDNGSKPPETFHQVYCFGGQVRINSKRLTFRSYEILLPKEDGSCCGGSVRKGKTDQHGHFLVEPLEAGRYYARFDTRGPEEVVGFRVLQNYDKCNAGHVEISLLPDGRSTVQQYIDLDVDLSDCDPEEAACYRR